MRHLVVCLTLIVLAQASIRSADAPSGFEPLFNGKNLDGWKVVQGKKPEVWGVDNGILFVNGEGGGWLMTENEYGDFEIKLEYKVTKMGNSGVALRSPLRGNPAYAGMEIQIIDEDWKGLQSWQHTGSIYGVVPPSKQATKPVGEWNKFHIIAKGRQITVNLNGTTIVDANLDDYKTKYGKEHPGILREKGHIGLQSHNDRVEFRNLYVKPL